MKTYFLKCIAIFSKYKNCAIRFVRYLSTRFMFKIRVKFELYDSLENGSSVEEVDLSGNNCSELNSLQLLTAAYLLNTLTLKSAKYEFGHTLQQGFILYKILWGEGE